jgi:hypothetical protein
MDRSEDERRPAQRAGDQSESEGSRGEQRAQRERDKEEARAQARRPGWTGARMSAGPRSGPEIVPRRKA